MRALVRKAREMVMNDEIPGEIPFKDEVFVLIFMVLASK